MGWVAICLLVMLLFVAKKLVVAPESTMVGGPEGNVDGVVMVGGPNVLATGRLARGSPRRQLDAARASGGRWLCGRPVEVGSVICTRRQPLYRL
jgi:hypothetical protein